MFPFVQEPHGFLEKVVTANNTIPVIGKRDKQVRIFAVILWPIYYIGGTAMMWVGVQIENATVLAASIASWLGLT
ncbi:hypothetical protein A3B05_01920 [Candidatus Giovannonibacteria bacterium RIFCSPLOWO2_01_FULL_43_160]|uniref:Uncharacterized protein n=1 Tax=Candidatus Giovannonibacteria bacterium RIFCSPLOWO2_12_FULL_43_26 TaxID=1798363 RepID=A0A1F5XUW2_9BACT|nr:MAG: hypothetical protein A2652_01870 [Candidatus Giovannonibacteria bacterium RIFCSPHIGHO2_01_FULL_43_140]OGF70039.1 MAG: hypothetical protein A3C76_02540 [Candidatus Giovannonibacteria bacterium RIFCSPHIGHO2_02_FULL_44_51]OGF72051.1 MAG: hypothetical protein A3E35_03640 [Candidatus Giovannonibacteria bacterium RIFCSPHIGHO2_12_FULL_44_22]OGF75381.1 MAG: hypothetical protein A3B05_01920 [Candidatus Giovannonibacteria bacterium RIFCSPLOWO2_01_FULL_43_160]OGF85792.1 MAG: hypothetical protein A